MLLSRYLGWSSIAPRFVGPLSRTAFNAVHPPIKWRTATGKESFSQHGCSRDRGRISRPSEYGRCLVVTWWQSPPGGWQGPWQPVRGRFASGSPQSGLDDSWSSMHFGFAMSMTKTKTIRSSFQSLGNPWQLISHNLPNNTSCKLYSLKNFERPNQDCPHNRQQAAKTINLHKYCQKPVQTNIEPTGSNRHTACKK